MGEAISATALAAKTAVGRKNHLARAMTVQKALRVSIAKVADETLELPMAALSISDSSVANDELADSLEEGAILVLFDGPYGAPALITADAQFCGGIVQQMTMGKVLPDKGDTRALTRTDAAIIAPLIEDLMHRVAAITEDPEDAKTFQGYRFGAMAEDQRIALMALEAPNYQVHALTLDISKGVRQGKLSIYLPCLDEADLIDLPTEDESEDAEPPVTMTDTVLRVEAELDVVLCKVTLELSEVHALHEGQLIPVPPKTFPHVTITGLTGGAVATGVIGQIDGQRAVQPDMPELFTRAPQRRASDRGDVDQPDIAPLDGQGPLPEVDTSPRGGVPLPDDGGLPDLDAPLPDLPSMDDMPELADLQRDGEALPELPDLPDLGEELPELSDLPDLTTLPELDGLPDLPDLKSA